MSSVSSRSRNPGGLGSSQPDEVLGVVPGGALHGCDEGPPMLGGLFFPANCPFILFSRRGPPRTRTICGGAQDSVSDRALPSFGARGPSPQIAKTALDFVRQGRLCVPSRGSPKAKAGGRDTHRACRERGRTAAQGNQREYDRGGREHFACIPSTDEAAGDSLTDPRKGREHGLGRGVDVDEPVAPHRDVGCDQEGQRVVHPRDARQLGDAEQGLSRP